MTDPSTSLATLISTLPMQGSGVRLMTERPVGPHPLSVPFTYRVPVPTHLCTWSKRLDENRRVTRASLGSRREAEDEGVGGSRTSLPPQSTSGRTAPSSHSTRAWTALPRRRHLCFSFGGSMGPTRGVGWEGKGEMVPVFSPVSSEPPDPTVTGFHSSTWYFKCLSGESRQE